MKLSPAAFCSLLVFLLAPCAGSLPVSAEVDPLRTGGFAFEKGVLVPGSPEEAYRAFTRETKEWWDHHFSDAPHELYFDARPGGCFLEVFDASGDGACHARVIYAKRGEEIRFVGPLGLSGSALEMVHTLTFVSEGEATRLRLRVRAFGEMQEGWGETVERVWDHFLERFRTHRARAATPPEDEAAGESEINGPSDPPPSSSREEDGPLAHAEDDVLGQGARPGAEGLARKRP